MGNLTQTAAFQKELLKLGQEDQFRVYETLAKLGRDSRGPGLQLKRMERVDLWEIRVTRDLRIIAELENDDIFCYSVGHHDEALRRAERVSGVDANERCAIRQHTNAFVAAEPTGFSRARNPIRERHGPLAEIPDSDIAHHCWRCGWEDADTEALESACHKRVLAEGREDHFEDTWVNLFDSGEEARANRIPFDEERMEPWKEGWIAVDINLGVLAERGQA